MRRRVVDLVIGGLFLHFQVGFELFHSVQRLVGDCGLSGVPPPQGSPIQTLRFVLDSLTFGGSGFGLLGRLCLMLVFDADKLLHVNSIKVLLDEF